MEYTTQIATTLTPARGFCAPCLEIRSAFQKTRWSQRGASVGIAQPFMYCTNCGGSIEAAASFCVSCGARKPEPAPKNGPREYRLDDAASLPIARQGPGGDRRAPSWLADHGWLLLAFPCLAIVIALFEPSPQSTLAAKVGEFIGWVIGAIAIASIPVAMSAMFNRLRKAQWRSGVHDWVFAVGLAAATLLLYLGSRAP